MWPLPLLFRRRETSTLWCKEPNIRRGRQNFKGTPKSCNWLELTAANGFDIPYVGFIEMDVTVFGQVVPNRGILVVKDPPGTDPNRTALVIEEASWTSTTATAPTVLLYFPHPTTIMATEQELRDLVQQLQARPPSLTANSEFTELRQLLEKQQEQLNQLTQGLLALQTAPRPPVRRPNTLLCLRCQKPGHFARECDNERFIPQARPQHVAATSALQEAGNFNPLV
uniref:CCHC-type domain-containing protein n=1 Tax=Knipowitschia caucasica TaxID=637954 RepID=A0AAV2LUL2_KNICA